MPKHNTGPALFTETQLREQQAFINDFIPDQARYRFRRHEMNGADRDHFAQDIQRAKNLINTHYPEFYAPQSTTLDGQAIPSGRKPFGALTQEETDLLAGDMRRKIMRDIHAGNVLDRPLNPTFGSQAPIAPPPAQAPNDQPRVVAAGGGEPDHVSRRAPPPSGAPAADPPQATPATASPQPESPAPQAPPSDAAAPQTPDSAPAPDAAAPAAPAASASEHAGSTRKAVMGSGDQVMKYDGAIREAQFKLTGMGIPCGPIDGLEGPLTRGGFDRYANEFNPPLNLREMTAGQLITHMDEHKAEIEAKYGPRRDAAPAVAGPAQDPAAQAPAAQGPEAQPEGFSMDDALLSQADPNAPPANPAPQSPLAQGPVNLVPAIYDAPRGALAAEGGETVPDEQRGRFAVQTSSDPQVQDALYRVQDGQPLSGATGSVFAQAAVYNPEAQNAPEITPAIELRTQQTTQPAAFTIA